MTRISFSSSVICPTSRSARRSAGSHQFFHASGQGRGAGSRLGEAGSSRRPASPPRRACSAVRILRRSDPPARFPPLAPRGGGPGQAANGAMGLSPHGELLRPDPSAPAASLVGIVRPVHEGGETRTHAPLAGPSRSTVKMRCFVERLADRDIVGERRASPDAERGNAAMERRVRRRQNPKRASPLSAWPSGRAR